MCSIMPLDSYCNRLLRGLGHKNVLVDYVFILFSGGPILCFTAYPTVLELAGSSRPSCRGRKASSMKRAKCDMVEAFCGLILTKEKELPDLE